MESNRGQCSPMLFFQHWFSSNGGGKEDQVNKCKIELSNGSKSDHLVIAEAVKLWEQAKTHGHSRDFCWDYFLSQNTLNLLKALYNSGGWWPRDLGKQLWMWGHGDMKEQFARYLYDMNFLSEQDVKAPTSNVNSNNLSLVKAIICAGLYPNIAIIKSVKRRNHTGKVIIKLSTPEDGRVELHPKSINEKMSDFESSLVNCESSAFDHKATESILKIVTLLQHLKEKEIVWLTTPFPVDLVSARLHSTNTSRHCQCHTNSRGHGSLLTTSIVLRQRKKKTDIYDLRNRLDGLLEHKVTHPGVIDWSRTSEEGALLRSLRCNYLCERCITSNWGGSEGQVSRNSGTVVSVILVPHWNNFNSYASHMQLRPGSFLPLFNLGRGEYSPVLKIVLARRYKGELTIAPFCSGPSQVYFPYEHITQHAARKPKNRLNERTEKYIVKTAGGQVNQNQGIRILADRLTYTYKSTTSVQRPEQDSLIFLSRLLELRERKARRAGYSCDVTNPRYPPRRLQQALTQPFNWLVSPTRTICENSHVLVREVLKVRYMQLKLSYCVVRCVLLFSWPVMSRLLRKTTHSASDWNRTPISPSSAV
uniref:DEAD-box helicase OB fold domain-containing protein n=1 Tax=Timema poppense TaxID=170557 RepID=A0A7R9D731_TIMPO|nr:unnamed protein product [Timema poppensis]